jgi:nondiscriminating glutamyl-tRNA synthetase
MLPNVRVRFAPSPTGYLHIGGARTALFNWLFARQNKGAFILRIEDTDEARSTQESVDAIIQSMQWLGLDWDEGPGKENPKYAPYFQMQRKDQGIYQKYVDQLIAAGHAYPCYCTPEEVESMRQKALSEKRNPKYDGACSCLTPEQLKQKEGEGRSAVIRYKMPGEGKLVLEDIIRGRVEFDNASLDDFVIMKANGVPTYNFACVVDDHLMEISHVIRGDDHLSNTPRQVHLYQVLGWKPPEFAHLSMILGPDGTRLSKRHGHTAVLEYRNEGYLPEAVVNYLALLGWSTEDSQQLFGHDELIQKFVLERCSKSSGIFDVVKLQWMSGEYLRKKTAPDLIAAFYGWLKATGKENIIQGWDRQLVEKTITLEQEKAKLLSEIPGLIDFFFTEKVEYKTEAVEKVFKAPTAKSVLEGSIPKLTELPDFSAETLEKFARAYALENGWKNGQVFHPLRVAISGRTVGPSLFHMMELLGRDESIRRLKNCLSKFFA